MTDLVMANRANNEPRGAGEDPALALAASGPELLEGLAAARMFGVTADQLEALCDFSVESLAAITSLGEALTAAELEDLADNRQKVRRLAADLRAEAAHQAARWRERR